MEFADGIKGRRSIRKFQDKKVPREVIEEIVEMARFAPSWKNSQTARYIVIDNKETIDRLATDDCVMNFSKNVNTLSGAPAVVLLTVVEGKAGFEPDGSFSTAKGDRWEMFDAGIAAQTFCLAAYEKGVGTVIMGIFDEKKIAEIVHIPEGEKIAAVIPMGYSAGPVKTPARKEVDEILRFAD